MCRMVAHAKDIVDHVRYPRPGPNIPAKTEGLGTLGQDRGDLCPLLGAQPWLTTGGRVSAQCLDTLLSCQLKPLAHCPGCHAECRSDIALPPALFSEFPSPKPAPFLPVAGSG
jgi:hypothetical protein